MIWKRLFLFFLLGFAFLSGIPGTAYAACTAPVKATGALEYFTATNEYKFCNGTAWVSVPIDSQLTACTKEAEIEYDTIEKRHKFCDATNFQKWGCVAGGCDWTTTTQKSKVETSNRANQFGYSVAGEGNFLVIGAPFEEGAAQGNNMGMVYLYDITDPLNPVQKSVITASGAFISNHRFGWSVSISGNIVAVGAYISAADGNQGSVYLFDITVPTAPVEKSKTMASDGTSQNYFGYSVDMSGNTLMVGAPQAVEFGVWPYGAAYLFDITDPAVPVEKSIIRGSDKDFWDYFGVSVAVNGNTAVVGALFDDGVAGVDAGAAYIFDITNLAAPTEDSLLRASDAATTDYFGWSVAIDGTNVLVGAYAEDNAGGTDAGSAYLFDITTPTAPVEKSKITASDGAAGDLFGTSLFLSGTTAVVGAYLDDTTGGSDAGSAYVFDITMPTAPVEKAKITASDEAVNNTFGRSVGISGTNAFIGATFGEVGDVTNTGSVYLYDISDLAAPVEQSEVADAVGLPSSGYEFGTSVAIEGTLALIGEPRNYALIAGDSSGIVYVFDVSNSAAPVKKSVLTASEVGPGGSREFGYNVAISGNVAIVGSTKDLNDKGAAYIFDLTDPSNPVETAKLVASNAAANDKFGNSIAISGNMVVIGASVAAPGTEGAVYLFDITNPSAPVEKAIIQASDKAFLDVFGSSVAIDGTNVLIGASQDDNAGGNNAGSAYLFDITVPTAPVEKAIIQASDKAASHNFGASVALNGNFAYVGNKSNVSSGHVYIFDITTPTAPVEKSIIEAPDAELGNRLGASLSLDGNILVTGAYGDNTVVGSNAGSFFIFDVTDPVNPVQLANPIASDEDSNHEFGNSISISNGVVVVGAHYFDNSPPNFRAGAAYFYQCGGGAGGCKTAGACTKEAAIDAQGNQFKYCDGTNWNVIAE